MRSMGGLRRLASWMVKIPAKSGSSSITAKDPFQTRASRERHVIAMAANGRDGAIIYLLVNSIQILLNHPAKLPLSCDRPR